MPFETLFSKGKGWFNAALFRKNITRFWPILALYTAIQFLSLPTELILLSGMREWTNLRQDVGNAIMGATSTSVPMGGIFGLLVAMALFSYLMNNRSAGMLHALPIRREGLFLTNWLTGFAFFIVPNAVVALISLAAQGVCGALFPLLTFRWFALHTVIAMFFFCFAVCCAMFTGHILALPAFYGILNLLVFGLSMLADNAMNVLLVGYGGNRLASSAVTKWCTPAWHLMNQVNHSSFYDGTPWFDPSATAIALGYCVVLGAAFTLIAVVTYQHRQLERAGDIVTVGWVRPVFQYGVGVCVGLTLGTILYENFFRSFGPWALVVGVALCAVLGGFIARMLLKKTLRVFANGWKGCAALGVCMLVLLGGARADLFGYQRWVPKASQVESVYVGAVSSAPWDSGSSGLNLEDPEEIQAILRLHTTLVEHLNELEDARQRDTYGWDEENFETASATWLRIEYYMTDGSVQTRTYYDVPITSQALSQPDTYAAQLQALINQPQLVMRSYLGQNVDPEDVVASSAWLTNVSEPDDAQPSGQDLDLTTRQCQTLWAAVVEDLEAGRFHRYLLEDRERNENCYYTDLHFSLTQPYYDVNGVRSTSNWDLRITVQKSATATIKALEEMGLTDRLSGRNDAPTGANTEFVG